MPKIRLNFMYDMNTSSKMGILGIHTPTLSQIGTRWSGLVRNYRYMKIKKCSVRIACASMLPADPLQIGVESGQISPADMMNPILYRAVSNDSWNTICNRIYATTGAFSMDSVKTFADAFTSLSQDQVNNIYYSLLSSPGWRKALPQSGLRMDNLRPLVYEVVSTYGNTVGTPTGQPSTVTLDQVSATAPGGSVARVSGVSSTFKGKARSYPAIPTVSPINYSGTSPASATLPSYGAQQIPESFVAMIVLPPAELNVFYYRMIVTWEIAFFGLRPETEVENTANISADGNNAHSVQWSLSSKANTLEGERVSDDTGVVQLANGDISLIMES